MITLLNLFHSIISKILWKEKLFTVFSAGSEKYESAFVAIS